MSDRKNTNLGGEYASLIAAYVLKNYGDRGLSLFREVDFGTTIIGKRRRVDILVVETATKKALALECKYQDTSGTTDEKIPYALQDVEAMRVPAAVVYAGRGFSKGVIHLLQGSRFAVRCFPHPRSLERINSRTRNELDLFSTWELDHLLAATFSWWDLLGEPSSADGQNQWPGLIALADSIAELPRKEPKRAPRQETLDLADPSIAEPKR